MAAKGMAKGMAAKAVNYADKFASRDGFFRLLMRWRGSVYKMVWRDMLAYVLLYYTIALVHRDYLPWEWKREFEKLVIYCARFRDLLPVSFVLGFYVTQVVRRWWDTYWSIPWPDTVAILVSTHVQGKDNAILRETIVRYVNLTIALTFAMVSPVVKKKFPTPQHFVDTGYMTQNEMEILENLEKQTSQHKTWVPVVWACRLVDRAGEEGSIKSGSARILTEILKVRDCCARLMSWNKYNIPLVYTQVVTIAVYSFFLFSVIGEQFLEPSQDYEGRTSILFFPFLQLVFYIGWLKVAEALFNPFGNDDTDFEFVPLLERNIEMSRLLSELADLPLQVESPGRPDKPIPPEDGSQTPTYAKTTASPTFPSKPCDKVKLPDDV